jgi:pimeloyl-ACP methyl ester carboxylesterase
VAAIDAPMALFKTLLIALVIFGGFVALMYAMQRSLMYYPERFRTPPDVAGLLDAQEVVLDTADGEKLIGWYVPPRDGKPLVLYFHGNAGALQHRVDRFRALIAPGNGLLALSYRGYGGSTGSPSEAGLIADAEAAYRFALARAPAERIVAFGESLGSGVAVALAASRQVGAVVLEAPFTSAADVGAAAAADARSVLFGPPDRRRKGSDFDPARHVRPGGADEAGRAAVCARQRAETLRAIRPSRPCRSRPVWRNAGDSGFHRRSSALSRDRDSVLKPKLHRLSAGKSRV